MVNQVNQIVNCNVYSILCSAFTDLFRLYRQKYCHKILYKFLISTIFSVEINLKCGGKKT